MVPKHSNITRGKRADSDMWGTLQYAGVWRQPVNRLDSPANPIYAAILPNRGQHPLWLVGCKIAPKTAWHQDFFKQHRYIDPLDQN
jgi:hypothetical protein